MRARAVGLALLLGGLGLLPFGAAGGPSCEDRMLAELGWLDAPAVGVALDLGAEDTHACSGQIQPGARMTNGCTMNFIFRDAQARLYVGTAGHCMGGLGDTLGAAGVGGEVATVVFDGFPGPIDFALARIDPGFYDDVDPTMCHWGGPSSVDADPTTGQTTHLYGWGSFYNLAGVTRARAGVLQGESVSEVTYLGFAQPGDSGSPIVGGDGQALGVHVRSSLGVSEVRLDPSTKFATRIDRALAEAEAATGLDLELVPGLAPFSFLGT